MVYLPEFEESLAKHLFDSRPTAGFGKWETVHPEIRDKYIGQANRLIVIFASAGWMPPQRH